MKRFLIIALATVGAAGSAVAADVLADTGISKEVASQTFLDYLKEGRLYMPDDVRQAMRKIPAAKHAATVKALGAVAKTLLASEPFKAEYAERRKAEIGSMSDADLQKAEASYRATKEADLKTFTEKKAKAAKAEQAELQATIDQIKADLEVPRAPPADPKAALKVRLKRYLAATADVKWGAKLKDQEGLKVFEDQALERKPREWKLAFRMGKDATEAARAFAKAWLAELK
jgi:opacity protein-like surface antigen